MKISDRSESFLLRGQIPPLKRRKCRKATKEVGSGKIERKRDFDDRGQLKRSFILSPIGLTSISFRQPTSPEGGSEIKEEARRLYFALQSYIVVAVIFACGKFGYSRRGRRLRRPEKRNYFRENTDLIRLKRNFFNIFIVKRSKYLAIAGNF